jgi:drug/metabolite transporter (DMT)-like permease
VVQDAPFTLGYIYILLQGWATVFVGYIFLSFNKQKIKNKNKHWSTHLQAGLVISGSYFLILVAMVFVKDAGDIVAFRQVSIPIGFLLGVFIMKEQVNRRKVLSVMTICFGLLLITIDI